MSLTGLPLLVTLMVITALMPVGVFWLWPRARGDRWLVVTTRVGAIVTAQLSALLLAAVALNDYGDFFSSWPQAFDAFFASAPHTNLGNEGLGNLQVYGATAAPVHAVAGMAVRVAPSDQLPAGLTPTSWSRPQQYPIRGAVATMPLFGPQSQLENTVAVYLPPRFFDGYRSLPVVEAITGYPSTYKSLAQKLALPSRLLAGIQAHTMGQFVMVMLPAGLPYPLDSECTDAPGGPFAFTYFDRDVPSVITRVLALQPTGFGAIGYSTGGYCAVKLAMLDPARFVAAASMSGYFHAQPGKYSPRMFGGSSQVRDLNDLAWRLRHLPPAPTSVLIMTGTEEIGADGWLTNQKFLREVRAPMHAERFIVPVDYGHSYQTWAQEASPALVWISRSLGAVARSGSGALGSALFSKQGLSSQDVGRRHHRGRVPGVGCSASPTPPPPTRGRR